MLKSFPSRRHLLVACIVSASVFTAYSVMWIPRVTHGFTMYYTYARMILEGEDFSRAYDYEYFNARVREYGIENMVDMPNNIPTNALVMLPLAWLPAGTAKIVWSILSLAALALSIKILFGLYGISTTENLGLGLLTLVFIWRPIYDNIALGQMYSLVLLLFSMSLVGIVRANRYMSTVPVGVAFLAKGYGLVPVLWLAFTKRFQEFGLVVLWIVLGILATLPLFGLGAWQTFYSSVVSRLGTLPTDAHVAFQTINGFVFHLFTYDAKWLPYPVLELPSNVVRLLSYTLNIILILVVFRRTGGTEPGGSLRSYSTAIAAGVVTAPLAEEYHFVLFLPLVLGLAADLVRQYGEARRVNMRMVVFGLSVLIMALPPRYKELQFASFPLILLAYPKLYAGVALLALSCLQRSK